jgi:hypothetical protein
MRCCQKCHRLAENARLHACGLELSCGGKAIETSANDGHLVEAHGILVFHQYCQ